MKQSIILTSLLLLLSFPVISIESSSPLQEPLSGLVSNEEGHPLPYVNIGIVGTTVGTVSGPDGYFVLFLTENVSGEDTLRFSMIGHKSRSFTIFEYSKMEGEKVVVLPTASMGLPEVVVRPRFTNKKRIGMERVNRNRVTNFAISKKPNQNLGAEIGRKFNLPKGEVQLDTFLFYISHNNFDTVRLRVNIYEIKKGKPRHHLATSNIIVELTNQQTGWVKVDLTPYQFIMQENVAVAVEWIYHSPKGRRLALPIAMPSGGIHFYKYGSQGKWKKFVGMSTAMILEVSY